MNVIERLGDQIVTLAEAKANSRVTSTAEDTLFQHWIDVAHDDVEGDAGLVLQRAKCTQVDRECEYIDLSAPVRGIVSVKDGSGDDVDYEIVETSKYGARLTFTKQSQVKVTYIAGFGEYIVTGAETAVNEGDIAPYPLAKAAVLVLTNHYYENRGVVTDFSTYPVPVGFDRIIQLITKYR
ncbi:MAG: hypothetical protein DWP95_10385 [Proteobacteria bacterium]|nr:MAG: hypothetical protein DWP95_10385 [Pseudomonadota bacterium]